MFEQHLPVTSDEVRRRQSHLELGMRLLCNWINLYLKLVNVCETSTRNMQTFLNQDNRIKVSNGKKLPVTTALQPAVQFIHHNIAHFCIKSLKYHVMLLTA